MTNNPNIPSLFDVHTVANYLHHLKKDLSPLKLQKSLYFLFAYHGALYAKPSEDGVFEGSSVEPSYLFDAQFEAWKYGPVIREVYNRDRDGGYQNTDEIAAAVGDVESRLEVHMFIDELFEQISAISDFKLVDRSHQDIAWKEAFEQGQSTVMDNNKIIQEYVENYVV